MSKQLRTLLLACLTAVAISSGALAAPSKGGVIDVATIGEPPTLDPMASSADLVGTISQHIFETLYTFDGQWGLVPLLAQSMPTISPDGKTYLIALRHGVKFHDGSEMTARDVVASLERWMRIANRGRQTASVVADLSAPDDFSLKIVLKQPFAPLIALLALNNSAAVILPARLTTQDPLSEFIGTGPYRLQAHVPDQYIQLARFDGYASRSGEPNGYGGARRQYLDEIRFVPVPDANTRVEGAVSGQFAYVDSLPVQSLARIQQGKSEAVILKPFGWPVFMMNLRQGEMANLTLRRAVQAALAPQDMLMAAFGTTDFFTVDGAMYPPGFVWHTTAGTEVYKPMGDTAKASALLKQAGYDGKPIRILTSRQYEFHYKMAQVAQAYLEAAGFKVQLDVVEWATLTQNRADPAKWDIFITHSPFLPEPSLTGMLSDDSPGWWSSETKHAAVNAFNRESDPQKRIALWAGVQQAIYNEVPSFKVGDFNSLIAQSPKLKAVVPSPWPYFWNAYLEK
ncbi:Dipeptide ABC transporter substrate binding protein [Sodalis praecaptivus]|uniref:Dipeptide ABC transporter substrate binding protein n=1 Tax=Sodalis praecaptivus TaxID=1239307 RepID=W0HU57_9GAMM|nr:ABC transporter substrate-binding protein [Sodalis praecaptivus]AHF77386.1 Dipeptide ABC transporter substrate binding protein [Sodalis praecaptivus]